VVNLARIKIPIDLKVRERYIAFKVKIEGDVKIDKKTVAKAIWKAALDVLGEVWAGSLDLWIMEYNEGTGVGILKCNSKSVEEVKAVMAFVDSVSERRAVIYPLYVSGTLKKLKRLLKNKETQ